MDTASKISNTLRWLPTYLWQRTTRRRAFGNPVHVLIAVADHFEPCILPGVHEQFAPFPEQERRLEHWCHEYPKALSAFPDREGFYFRHTFFYPAEHYEQSLISRLADHCREGWGEVEIHLHHGLQQPDTRENTKSVIEVYRDALVQHGCLSKWEGTGPARFAFVHGNWALANSARGRYCGVDEELQLLADAGCYADFTLPSAPSPAQIRKINSLYETGLPLEHRAAHRQGRDLSVGHSPEIFPLNIQGPLMLNFGAKNSRRIPLGIENSELSGSNPPTLNRFWLWWDASIQVAGRPDWLFMKLHCHGMDPRDESAMYGQAAQKFLRELMELEKESGKFRLHFVTAREMVNVILAACDGRDGNPGEYRDYRLRLIAQAGSGRC